MHVLGPIISLSLPPGSHVTRHMPMPLLINTWIGQDQQKTTSPMYKGPNDLESRHLIWHLNCHLVNEAREQTVRLNWKFIKKISLIS